MAACTRCGAELTGEICSQCSAPATGAPRRRRKRPVIERVLITFGWLLGFVFLSAIIVPLFTRFETDKNQIPPRVVENETIQTAINAFMADNALAKVTPSTSGGGGEKIRSTGTQFHPTINLSDYWSVYLDYKDQGSTGYCYKWDTDGRITFQYDIDDNGNCSSFQLYPDKRGQ